MNVNTIYDQINKLRTEAITKAYQAGELSDRPLDAHLDGVADLGPADWTEDDVYGRSLGHPESDWSVTVDGDTVQVWAAGGIEASAVIEGAGQL